MLESPVHARSAALVVSYLAAPRSALRPQPLRQGDSAARRTFSTPSAAAKLPGSRSTAGSTGGFRTDSGWTRSARALDDSTEPLAASEQPHASAGIRECRTKVFKLPAGVHPVDELSRPQIVDAAEVTLTAHPPLSIDDSENELARGLHLDHLLDLARGITELAAR